MSHAVVVKAARKFAASGFPVFRFDFSGCGDSEGDLQFSSVEEWQQDLSFAIEVFRQETGIARCVLWGLRLGAGLALMQAQSKSIDIAGLILWQPVLDFSTHIKQFLRRTISAQISQGKDRSRTLNPATALQTDDGLTYVVGYPVSQGLYDSFEKIGAQPADVALSVPIFALSISAREQPAFYLKNYGQSLQKAGVEFDLQHITAEPFWDRYWQWDCEKSAKTTLVWLQGIIN